MAEIWQGEKAICTRGVCQSFFEPALLGVLFRFVSCYYVFTCLLLLHVLSLRVFPIRMRDRQPVYGWRGRRLKRYQQRCHQLQRACSSIALVYEPTRTGLCRRSSGQDPKCEEEHVDESLMNDQSWYVPRVALDQCW